MGPYDDRFAVIRKKKIRKPDPDNLSFLEFQWYWIPDYLVSTQWDGEVSSPHVPRTIRTAFGQG